MPYASSFDDPSRSIRRAIESVRHPAQLECVRLDEHGMTGRLIGQLEQELKAAQICVADVSSTVLGQPGAVNPNVMWEIGFAMALGKPVVLVSDGALTLPFDLHDVRHIAYERSHLGKTLEDPLRTLLERTAAELARAPQPTATTLDASKSVLEELRNLREIVLSVVSSPHQGIRRTVSDGLDDPSALRGAWKNLETSSHAYVEVVGGAPVAAYCYGGDHELSGVYYDWLSVDDWYFARFAWRHQPVRGFSFLKPHSPDRMVGAWWFQGEAREDPQEAPDTKSGAASTWIRCPDRPTPKWASELHEEVRRCGVVTVLQRFGAADR
jgi:hypothetical protein